MTSLNKRVSRRGHHPLDGSYGPDRGRRLAVTLVPGTDAIPDLVEIRPEGTRRVETVAVVDIYRWAIQSRVNRCRLEKAREAKARKAERLAYARRMRLEKKLTREARADRAG